MLLADLASLIVGNSLKSLGCHAYYYIATINPAFPRAQNKRPF